MKVLSVLLWLGLVVGSQTPTTYYVNIDHPNCADVVGAGTEDRPFCTMRYTASVAWPGREYIVASKRDGTGPVEFTRSGTSTAPIVWKSTAKTAIGCFTDIRDEDFVPTDVPGVFSMTALGGRLWQTHYPKIVVDDPGNASFYEMVSTDGPLALAQATDDSVLTKIEGTYRRDATTGILRVHPYGSVTPSTTASDFVVEGGRCVQFASTTKYNVFDGFTITYGSVYNFAIRGQGHIVRNTTWIGVPGSLNGTDHVVEDYKATHVHTRDASGNWLWHLRGSGLSFDVNGSRHRLSRGTIWHSWNASISTEDASDVTIDGLIAHGSPNHCGAGTGGANNVTVRNAVMFNCQDTQWVYDTQHMVMEFMVIPGSGIALSSNRRTLGPITIRNSIFGGSIRHVIGQVAVPFPNHGCTWEKGSLIEHNIISPSATIERCSPTPTTYPIQTYMQKCAAGEFVDANGVPDCATIRNNRFVSDFTSVIVDGMWTSALKDSWNVHLVPQSPAIDAGTSSGATTDLEGTSRPQGPANDAGVYEVAASQTPVDCVVSDWTEWQPTTPWVVANWAQTRTEQRTRTVVTPPANGGAACPELVESRTVTQPCQSITLTPALVATCHPG